MSTGRHEHESPEDDSHEQWDELAVGYALSALEPDELDRFVNHLVHFCADCARSVADTDIVGAGIAAALDVPEPSASLRDNVLAAAFAARPPVPQTTADVAGLSVIPVAADPVHAAPPGASGDATGDASAGHPGDELAERRRRRGMAPARLGWLVAAAAAVVAIVMSVTAFSAFQSRDDQSALAKQRGQVISAFTGSGSARLIQLRSDGGQMAAHVVAHKNSVVVVPDDMAVNSSSTTYVLWGLTSASSTPVALGVFDVTGAHTPATVGSDARGYDEFSVFAISHEPGHTAPASPSEVVAMGEA